MHGGKRTAAWRTRDDGWQGRVEDARCCGARAASATTSSPSATAAAVFVRSPHAHARITGIDTTEAAGMPGVIAVITAKSLEGANLADGHRRRAVSRQERRHAGQPDAPGARHRSRDARRPARRPRRSPRPRLQAQDAAETVAVEYEPLDAAIDTRKAATGAPQLWPRRPATPRSTGPRPTIPMARKRKAVDAAFASAAHVARISLLNQRIAAVSMEPRVATASFDAADRRLYAALRHAGRRTASSHADRDGDAARRRQAARADRRCRRRLRHEGVGLSRVRRAAAARPGIVGRPLHWVSTRSEAFVSDNQARDQWWDAELAIDKDGRFTALRIDRPRQHRRVSDRRRPVLQHRARVGLPADGLRHPQHRDRQPRRVHQRVAGRALSRRRPARGELPDGAAGRCRRTRRPGSTPPRSAAAT